MVQDREWAGRTDSEADFLRVKGAKSLEDDQKRVLRAVWEYRDGKAKSANRPAFKLIPDPFLLTLARAQPSDIDALNKLARKGSSMLRRHGDALVAAVQRGVEDERDIPELPKPPRSRNLRMGPGMERYLNALKDWRNDKVAKTGVPPVAVANNTLLKEVARLAPADLETLKKVPGIRRWQVADHGDELLSVIQSVKAKKASEPQPDTARRRPRRRRRSKKSADEG